MSTQKPVSVALVGVAHIHTPQFVRMVAERPGINVKCVWDPEPERAAKYAAEIGSVAVSDVNAVWNDPEIPGVVVYSETDRHIDLVSAAAKAKKHIFAEKPLAGSAKESFEMAAAIEKAGVLFTTGYFNRTIPEHLFIKEQIERGGFGKITRVRGSTCHNGSLGGWFDTDYRWMADPKIAGVGAFGDLGTHSLDILMWLMGGVESATADIQIVTDRYPGCDESGEALLKFDSGVIGTLAAGWVDVDNPLSLMVSGTEAHAAIIRGKLHFKSNQIDGADGKEPWTDLPAAGVHPLMQFFDALEGKSAPNLVKPAEAAARVAVMEACYKGAESHSWVKVAKG